MRKFPHPEPIFFRETAFFSFFQKKKLFSLIRGKKGVILGRDKKISSPGSPCTTYIKHKYMMRSGFWAVIFSNFHST